MIIQYYNSIRKKKIAIELCPHVDQYVGHSQPMYIYN